MQSHKALKKEFQKEFNLNKDDSVYLQNYRLNVLVSITKVIKVRYILMKVSTLVLFELNYIVEN